MRPVERHERRTRIAARRQSSIIPVARPSRVVIATSETAHVPVSARRLFSVPPALGALNTVVRENERISNRLGSLTFAVPSARAVEDCGCAPRGVMASDGFLETMFVVDASRACDMVSRAMGEEIYAHGVR